MPGDGKGVNDMTLNLVKRRISAVRAEKTIYAEELSGKTPEELYAFFSCIEKRSRIAVECTSRQVLSAAEQAFSGLDEDISVTLCISEYEGHLSDEDLLKDISGYLSVHSDVLHVSGEKAYAPKMNSAAPKPPVLEPLSSLMKKGRKKRQKKEISCDALTVLEKSDEKLSGSIRSEEKYALPENDFLYENDLQKYIERSYENFQEMLFRLIDESGMTDPEVYKRANIDRKLFSKIRSNPDYHPKKETVIALCIALELDIDRTKDLMRRAEYAFSPSRRKDLILCYCIEHGQYDLYKVNEILVDFGETCL